jgi:class 3 adenylate cyclase
MVRPHSSISLKITVLVLCGASLVFALALAYSYSYSRRIILEEAEKGARGLTLSVARRIEQEFRAAAKVPKALSAVLEASNPDKDTLIRIMSRMVEESREVYGSAVAFEPGAFEKGVRWFAPYCFKDKSGLKYEQIGSASYDYFTKDWYHVPMVLKAPVWTDPYFDEGAGGIIMTTHARPFFESGGKGSAAKVRGIVTVDVSLEWLTKLVCSVQVGRTGYCFIISDTGAFVTHPNPELIMSESLFSLAEERHAPDLRRIGLAMERGESGFTEIGPALCGEEAFLAYAKIPSPGWSLGAVFPKKELLAEMNSLHERTVLLAAGGLLLLLVVSGLVARSIARPLRRMAAATEKVAHGNLDIDLSDIRSTDEVGRLAQSFVRMTEGLKERDRIRDTFGRYLTREVVNRLLESKDGLRLGGENREITMIMSDLRGFTALTSSMPPQKVLHFLNRYLGKMVEILIDYQGTIDEIIGDGILAFFGAPEPLDDHPARAVACALEMQAAMDEINSLNEADGLPRLDMGVAVNTGSVVVGNIGSEKRAKYGAVGSQVNFTGRIESFTVGGQVLISRSTYERLSEFLDIRNVLKVQMKGMPGKVSLYDVCGIKGPYQAHLPDRDETPVPLERPINVQLYRLNQKILAEAQVKARITHISLTSAAIALKSAIGQWEDIRLLFLNDDMELVPGEVYAKVVSAATKEDGWEATVRFTSVSPEAYKMFREATPGS